MAIDQRLFTKVTHFSDLNTSFAYPVLRSLCVLLTLWIKAGAYFAIGLYLLCCVYSIAYFSPNCNIQNKRNSQNNFVEVGENQQNGEKIWRNPFTFDGIYAIMVNVVVSLEGGCGRLLRDRKNCRLRKLRRRQFRFMRKGEETRLRDRPAPGLPAAG